MSQAAEEDVGKIHDVNVRDIGGIVGLGYNAEASGILRLKREPNEDHVRVMSAVDGSKVVVSATVKGVNRTGTITTESGNVRYSPDEHLVKLARLKWTADIDWIPPDYLIFGTQSARNLNIHSYYEADLVDPGGDKSP